jgi:hypothetical protein
MFKSRSIGGGGGLSVETITRGGNSLIFPLNIQPRISLIYSIGHL